MTQLAHYRLTDLLSHIVDNRGRSCPTAETGFPLIATNCVKDDQLYPVFENVRYVDQETYINWFRDHPKPGDILFVCKGSPGRAALVPNPVPFCIAQDMVALRTDPAVINNRYLYYQLTSVDTRRKIENMHVGTMIPHFKKGDFNQLRLAIHEDLNEQAAIAEVLGALDDKIAANAILSSSIDEFIEANLEGQLQLEAQKYLLDEVAEFHNRRRIPLSARQREERPGSIPYYGATGIFGYVDEPIFHGPLVLVGEDGSVANNDGTAVAQYVWGPSWVNNHAHVLTGTKVSTELLFYVIRRGQVSKLVTGAVQPKLNMHNLKQLELKVPTVDTLEWFEQQVAATTARKRKAVEESTTLTYLRDFLLPHLMSGKLRVKDAEKVVEGAV